jgi:DNA-binding beta-propeller fold protein YncE
MKRCAGVSFWARNPKTSLQTRAAGPLLVCALVMVLGVGIGHGQPVPDTILLPDSLGPLRPPYHLAFGSSTNIYVASESSDIIVVDGNTFQRIKRINTGTPVGGALLVSQHNKLYCSYPQQGRIGVIDCATNSIIRIIDVGTRPTLLCYSSGSDKLYCGDTIDGTISVIGCATNTVLKVIPVGDSLTAMAYDPTSGKVYAATRDAVRAISCSADSVVASINAVRSSRGLCMNKRRQKLYVVGPEWTYPAETLYVISTGSDSLAAKIPVPVDQFSCLACNEATDRLYDAVDFGFVCEIDCVGDTVIDYCYLGDIQPRGLVCDTFHNRLYYLSYVGDEGDLIEVDCATMEVSSVIPVHPYPAILEPDPARYRLLYAGGRWECVLTALDYKGDSLYARGGAPLCGWKGLLCRNTVDGKLYYRWGTYHGGVGVIDEQTRRVVTLLSPPQVFDDELVYSVTSNRAYFHAGNGLGVIDGTSDSILRIIEIGDGVVPPFCWCPDENKVYCYAVAGARKYIAAVDCVTDSVVRETDVYDVVYGMQYLGNHRLLCWEYDRLILLDCRTDSVLVDTFVGANLYAFAHTGDGEKVYIAHGTRVEVLDASSLSLLTTVDWTWAATRGSNPFLMCSDSTSRMYWFERDQALLESDSVLAIDTRGDTAVSSMGVGHMQLQGCLDHSGRYIYNPNPVNQVRPFPDSNSLIVYDTQSDSVAALYEHLPVPVSAIPNSDEDRIYVGCQDVILVYPDAPPGVAETPNPEVRATKSDPTVVKGVLLLPEAAGHKPQAASLMDISGRKVLDLRPGENDVRAMPSGIYFVRTGELRRIRKIAITR